MRVFFLFGFCLCAAAQNAAVDRVFAQFDKKDSPGCSVAVTSHGKLVYSRGYGMADLDHDVPITPSSVFHVASISKEFTAASILLLEHEGKLSIDDEVRKYIPELPDFGVKVTLRHLLHHSSGLRDQWSLLGLAGWRVNRDLITDQDVLDILSRQKGLNFRPGDEYLYSNSGFTLLAVTVQRVSGKTLREFTRERIFEPLGMSHTFFRNDHGEIVKQQAYGYEPRGRTWWTSPTGFDTTGATSLLTTAEDFAKWMANFDEPRVIPQVIAKMQERGRFNSGTPMEYAFGLAPGTYRGLAITGHGGADAGYRSDFLRFPSEQLSVATLCNAANARTRVLNQDVAETYLSAKLSPAPKVPAPATVPDAALGLYYSRQTAEVRRLALHEGKVMLYSAGPRWESLGAGASASEWVIGTGPATVKVAGDRLTETRPGNAPYLFERRPEWAGAELASFTGTYRSGELDASWEITLRDGKLWLKRRKFAAIPMNPLIQDGFLAAVDGGEGLIEFQRDGAGRVSGFALSAGRVRHIAFTR